MAAILEKRDLRDFDWLTTLLAIAIVSFGVWQIYNAQPTENYWSKQIVGLGIALVAFLVVGFSDYRRIVDAAPVLYGIGLVLLVLVLIPGIGMKINGQQCWIKVPLIGQFQPSEFVKIPVVLMLAKYFGKLKNNERTLIFATFTAEEIGGFGSQYFSHQFDPAKVAAMFNIEMIGSESKWGTNSALITGYEKTDMAKILEKNLAGSKFTFHPDPYPEQQLFYRSDNATLARQGVPAHTISTTKIDQDKYYHTQADEIGTLDLNNMAEIIKSIAISARSIIAGTDTPTRVDATQLR